MPVTTLDGHEIHVDDEGFMTVYDEWSEDLGKTLAAQLGIDMTDVTDTLEDEGVASFTKSFDELIDSLTAKARTLAAALEVKPAGRIVSLYDQNEASRVPALLDDITKIHAFLSYTGVFKCCALEQTGTTTRAAS